MARGEGRESWQLRFVPKSLQFYGNGMAWPGRQTLVCVSFPCERKRARPGWIPFKGAPEGCRPGGEHDSHIISSRRADLWLLIVSVTVAAYSCKNRSGLMALAGPEDSLRLLPFLSICLLFPSLSLRLDIRLPGTGDRLSSSIFVGTCKRKGEPVGALLQYQVCMYVYSSIYLPI